MAPRPVGDSYGGYRSRLVEEVRATGVRDLAVLRAVGETPRHLFVPEAVRHQAYEDHPLPIGNGQTISQPSIQARFLELLELNGTENVLEVGTGSGYQTALLSMLARTVVSIERVRELADSARDALRAAGVTNVTILVGDGTLGWAALGPYDGIVVSAASPEIPAPLIAQLAEGGRMVIPVDVGGGRQEAWRIVRHGTEFHRSRVAEVRFVPLIGKHGFAE